MNIISKHQTFGDALDAMFDDELQDLSTRQVDGQWCVVQEIVEENVAEPDEDA